MKNVSGGVKMALVLYPYPQNLFFFLDLWVSVLQKHSGYRIKIHSLGLIRIKYLLCTSSYTKVYFLGWKLFVANVLEQS